MTAEKTMYLCYDLKGIQSFIFAVPRLRYICGGSALVDRFDREVAPGQEKDGATLVFSGGGKGSFECASPEVANRIQAALVEKAHEDGMSICFGRHQEYSEAANLANRNFPYMPSGQELAGHPCPESGLYPTSAKVHPMIRKRWLDEGTRMDRWFEEKLLRGLTLPREMGDSRLEFFHEIGDETGTGRRASAALGDRNRWAIVAMDGNDMGAQHRAAAEQFAGDGAAHCFWVRGMSRALDECCVNACRDGIQQVIQKWDKEEMKAATHNGTCILPVRPLLVGGDDIVVLCHVRYAMEFVRTVCRSFEERSTRMASEYKNKACDLWPGTQGRLSISAGILFAPVSLPLASAIPYAEALLASAKGEGRKRATDIGKGPTPACVDWESVAEGLLDSPHARRQRELVFEDGDTGDIVELTRRPYSISELKDLDALKERYVSVPGSIRHQVLSGLHAGYWDRQVFLARVGKNHDKLMEDLMEGENPEKPGGKWKREKDEARMRRSTCVVDALLLLEEDSRMEWKTA